MKALLISISILGFHISSFSQTNTFPDNGNVGIGTLNPQAWFPGNVLQLNGNRPILRLAPNIEGGLGTILFKGSYSETPGTPDEFHLNYVSSVTNPRITIGTYQNQGAVGFSILGNGNVGIGTEFPADKLSVNGKIRAHEIKVEAANWPDYVFAKEHQLPTLQETEKHIKEKGHLPGIPSAVDVKTNGIDVGEMNAKLLQKIEELTLYLIEQSKELRNQNSKIEAQSEEIKTLKSKILIN